MLWPRWSLTYWISLTDAGSLSFFRNKYCRKKTAKSYLISNEPFLSLIPSNQCTTLLLCLCSQLVFALNSEGLTGLGLINYFNYVSLGYNKRTFRMWMSYMWNDPSTCLKEDFQKNYQPIKLPCNDWKYARNDANKHILDYFLF